MPTSPNVPRITGSMPQTLKGLAKLLATYQGGISDVRSLCTDQTSTVTIRVERLQPQHVMLRSEKEAKCCFDILHNYYKHFAQQSDPLLFKIVFGNVLYNIEDMRSATAKKSAIPDKAPEQWPGKRHTTESPVDFFARVWAQYLKFGLDSATLKKLDRKLWEVIKKDADWPSQYRVLSNYDKMAAAVDKMQQHGWDSLTAREKVAVTRKQLREQELGLVSSPIRPLDNRAALDNGSMRTSPNTPQPAVLRGWGA